MTTKLVGLAITELLRCKYYKLEDQAYIQMTAGPATGLLYITDNAPYFLSGHIRLRGRDEGRYPYKYLEMIDYLFGPQENTIEVCSRYVREAFTVDINPAVNPDLVDDAQQLSCIADNSFNRWRADPPYNEATALSMYNTKLPNTGKLLAAGARLCKPGSLLFLLLGPQNYQWCPPGVKRIGWICCTIVPNNELRALHILIALDQMAQKDSHVVRVGMTRL
jgi:hypothetical protein